MPPRTRNPDLLACSHGRDPYRISPLQDRPGKGHEPGDLEGIGDKDNHHRPFAGFRPTKRVRIT